jgi:hypothetical protein
VIFNKDYFLIYIEGEDEKRRRGPRHKRYKVQGIRFELLGSRLRAKELNRQDPWP